MPAAKKKVSVKKSEPKLKEVQVWISVKRGWHDRDPKRTVNISFDAFAHPKQDDEKRYSMTIPIPEFGGSADIDGVIEPIMEEGQ